MADQQITIDIEARTEMARNKIAAMGQMFKGQTAAMTKSMQGVQQQIQALGKAKGIQMPGIVTMSDAMGEFDSRTQGVTQNLDNISQASNKAKSSVSKMGQSGQRAGHGMMEAFDGAAMGLMFFGMQVQRIFGGIMRTSISTFQKVHSRLEDTTTATDRLSGTWQYLKFQIGEALQPVMAWLQPIVETMANLVKENQNLVAGFLVTGVALGTLAMLYGAVKLGMLSIIAIGKRVNTALTKHMARVMGVTTNLVGFQAASVGASIAAGTMLAPVLLVAAALGALGYALLRNEENQQSFADHIAGPISDSLTDFADSLSISVAHIDSWSTFVDLATDYLKIFGAFIVDVVRVLAVLLVQAVTSTIEIIKLLGKIVYDVGQGIVDFGEAIWELSKNVFDSFISKGKAAISVFKAIGRVIANPFSADDALDDLTDSLDKLMEFDTSGFTDAIRSSFEGEDYFGGEGYMDSLEEIAQSGKNVVDSFNIDFTKDVIGEVKKQNRLKRARQAQQKLEEQTAATKPDTTQKDESDTKEQTQKKMLGEMKKSNFLTEQQNQLLQKANVSKDELFSDKVINYANQTR